MKVSFLNKIFILALFLSLTMPIAALFLDRVMLTMAVLSILVFGFSVLSILKQNLNINAVYAVIFLILWCIFSALAYAFQYMQLNNVDSFFSAYSVTFARFFPNLLIILLPLMLLAGTLKPSKKLAIQILIVIAVVLLVDVIFQIRAISVFPDAVRAKSSAQNRGFGSVLVGLVGYPQIYAFSLLVPLALSVRKMFSNKTVKLFSTLILIIILFSVLTSNLATAGIIAVIGLALPYVFKKNKNIVSLTLLLIVTFILVFNLNDILLWLSGLLEKDSTWATKLQDIALSLSSDESVGDVAGRGNLYMKSFDVFLDSPLLGLITAPGKNIGLHSTVLDILASTGIIGFGCFATFLWYSYRYCTTTAYYKSFPEYVNATYILFIIMICLKNTISSFAIYAVMFGLLPLFYTLYDSSLKEKPDERI